MRRQQRESILSQSENDILLLKGHEIESLLSGREREIIRAVRTAYETHSQGDSSIPHSIFLRFPDQPQNRIIALPAYLGGERGTAGIKWVSSFPGNLANDLDRASAVMILNSTATGRPQAIIEGSLISAKRTAASAALAAHYLLDGKEPAELGLVGCGVINFEIVRFILAMQPDIRRLVLFDLNGKRARHFEGQSLDMRPELEIEVVGSVHELFGKASLISIATSAIKPHIFDLSTCAQGATILHISLRDLSPDLILCADNVVDDIAHVNREQTSIHLASQLTGDQNFIRCTLADILLGRAAARRDSESIAIFSPFGLGVLDISVGKLVCELGVRLGVGTIIKSFVPDSWTAKSQAGQSSIAVP
ncbi:MAG: 2,3-diaminopropionate biosynthesis protein SbnB [Acidobacteria bacterium]|nr:MAG: 2,3-diaminopropionate biosynthesis protein SbnB [Acidobacteriota bacterium]